MRILFGIAIVALVAFTPGQSNRPLAKPLPPFPWTHSA